nr:oxidoreductase C-terminal domain-containing protein [Leisingera sp. F5]
MAFDAINDPRAYMEAKRLTETGMSPNPARVADIGSELKGLL